MNPIGRFRVHYFESERGWGSDEWNTNYQTLEEAREAMRECNSKNTSQSAPDYYIIAQYIEAFDEETLEWKKV